MGSKKMHTLNRLFVATFIVACLAFTYGCSSKSDGPAKTGSEQGGSGGNQGGSGGTQGGSGGALGGTGGTPVAVDLCKTKDCGGGSCSVSDGKAICACKDGFGNLNGTDGTCVACKEVNGPLNVTIPAAKVSFVLLKDGMPIKPVMPVSLGLGGNDHGFVASIPSDGDATVPLGVYSSVIFGVTLQQFIPGYEQVPETLNLGPVEVKADTKVLTLEMPRIVPIVARVPIELEILYLANESGKSFQVYRRDDRANRPFGVETAPELKGQFSFYGRPGKYTIVQQRSLAAGSLSLIGSEAAEKDLLARVFSGTNVKSQPSPTFDVPSNGVTAPIEVAFPVHKVNVNLKVNNGSMPCEGCKVRFYSTSGSYFAPFDKATSGRSVVLPSGAYVSFVTGSGDNGGNVGGPPNSSFSVFGAVHEVAKDQDVEININLVKVSGKLVLNGSALVPKSSGSYGSINAQPTETANELLSTANAQIKLDGTYAIWLPRKISHKWNVEVNKEANSRLFSSAQSGALEADLDGFDLQMMTKKFEVKVVGPTGWGLGLSSLTNENGRGPTLTSGTAEVAYGKYAVSTLAAEVAMSSMFSNTLFFNFATVDANETTPSVELTVKASKLSAKFTIGNEGLISTKWFSVSPSGLEKAFAPSTIAEGNNPKGDFFNLWLTAGQYQVYRYSKTSYLGCYVVKP